jgi:hypothetical protein
MTAPIDKSALLAYLLERGKSRSALVSAIYIGMADRVRRGEFDEKPESA